MHRQRRGLWREVWTGLASLCLAFTAVAGPRVSAPTLSDAEMALAQRPLLQVVALSAEGAQVRPEGLADAVDWIERSVPWAWQVARRKARQLQLPMGAVVDVHHVALDAEASFAQGLGQLLDDRTLVDADLVVLDAGGLGLPPVHTAASLPLRTPSQTWPGRFSRLPSSEGHPTSVTSSRVPRATRLLQQLVSLEEVYDFDVVWVERPTVAASSVTPWRTAVPRLRSVVASAPVDDDAALAPAASPANGNEAVHVVATDVERALAAHITRRLTEVPVNTTFDVLPIEVVDVDDGARRKTSEKTARHVLTSEQLCAGYAAAAARLEGWRLRLWDAFITRDHLDAIAQCPEKQPFVRHAREVLARPVDVHDFLLLLDDVFVASRGMLRGRRVHLPPSRLRGSGAFLHPHDVFRKKFKRKPYRRYPSTMTSLWIAPGKPPEDVGRAKNGDVLGPPWYRRYPNPGSERTRLRALQAKNQSFHDRFTSLVKQLRRQKVKVSVDSTVRKQQRGYLMFGAFWLSQATSEEQVRERVRVLQRLNRKWKLKVRIRWMHPAGWEATVDAAREMKDTYGVVYATRRGAEKSDHYDGEAVDVSVPSLPRRLRLVAPDGAKKTFRLHGSEQPRDLSLTPDLVEWIEEHYQLEKLLGDYPHWSDAAGDS